MEKVINYDNDEKNSLKGNCKKVKFVLWIILFANLGVAITKMVVGYLINSASLSTDGIHSLSDGLSNVVGLIGITIASIPVDKEHPYGHKKSEIIASLFIGGMLLFLGLKTLITGFGRFVNPGEISITLISLISLILTIGINIFVTIYERRKGEEYNSFILISDSIHTKSDIFISVGVLISLIGIRIGLPQIIDPIISIIISLFILRASYEIFKESIGILLDKAMIGEERIIEILNTFSEIKNIHNIRSRGVENDIYVDMHIMIDANTSIEDAHKLSHNIEREIKNNINPNCQVIIHIEPYHKDENVL
ncbi:MULTISPECIES: cation diffusion facilitator family transporter [Terrisporobacter]|uniref:Cation transporter n=1 Tax=Terrisporobacter othiniensis TaxID=1577792 RepID=A0A0B3WPG6_9FIRM|nr:MULTISPECIES: cation diffusion facilitator family transporter [Terrisporobacter]KHS56395.1 cation transporter [Terrisporobacter othiniensis]MCC3671094.1 cation diffusion facilitator family transporter [Terrisporobacter mayombei]MDU6984687.1 cation diffusion facilitator family transporter [Terrisporobacter othiniensis]